jgi:hypothetical protein
MATKKRIPQKKNDLMKLSEWPGSLQSRAGGRRYKPDRPGRATPHKAIAHDLPALYHETYLRVIPRDPWQLFSFWEIAEGSSVPGGAPLLRLYETDTGNGDKIIGDYAVGKGTRSQYIRMPRPGRRYRLEYGVATSDRFLPLCSSNCVEGPTVWAREPRSLTKRDKSRHPAAEALIGYSAPMLPAAASPQGIATVMTALTARL